MRWSIWYEVGCPAANGTGLPDVARHYHLAGRRRHASICALEAVKYADSGMAWIAFAFSRLHTS